MARNLTHKVVAKQMHVWLGKDAFKRGWNDYRKGEWDRDYERKANPIWYERGRLLAAAATGIFGPDIPSAYSGKQMQDFMGEHTLPIWREANFDIPQ